MAQPFKGLRDQIKFRAPVDVMLQLKVTAAEQGLPVTDVVSDLVSRAIGRADLATNLGEELLPLALAVPAPALEGPRDGADPMLKFRVPADVMLQLRVMAAERGLRVTNVASDLLWKALGRADLITYLNREMEELPLAI